MENWEILIAYVIPMICMVSLGIYNALQEHKKNNPDFTEASLTVICGLCPCANLLAVSFVVFILALVSLFEGFEWFITQIFKKKE